MNPFAGRVGRLEFWGLTVMLACMSLVAVMWMMPGVVDVAHLQGLIPIPFLRPLVLPTLVALTYIWLGGTCLNLVVLAGVLVGAMGLGSEGLATNLERGGIDPTLTGSVIGLFLILIVINIATLAVIVRRCHDLNRSGIRALITLVPLIGPMWFVLDLGCMGGDPFANTYDETG